MENKTIKRILTALTVLIMLIGIIVSAISIKNGDQPDEREAKQLGIIAYNAEAAKCQCNPEKTVDQFELEEVKRVKANIDAASKTSVGWAGILTIITIAVWIIFGVIGMVKNPKGIGKLLITSGAFILLTVIIYFATKSDSVPEDLATALDANGVAFTVSGYNLASWGIATSMILIILAALAWIGGGIYSMVKK